MDDARFISVLNAASQEHGLVMPRLREAEPPPGAFLSEWLGFLEACVRSGVALSDERWRKISVESSSPWTRFRLEADGQAAPDPDFRVGLQLLMGMLEAGER